MAKKKTEKKDKNQPQIWCAHPFFSERARHLSLLQYKLLHSHLLFSQYHSHIHITSPPPHHFSTQAPRRFPAVIRRFSDCDDSQARRQFKRCHHEFLSQFLKKLSSRSATVHCVSIASSKGYHRHPSHFSTVHTCICVFVYLYLRGCRVATRTPVS